MASLAPRFSDPSQSFQSAKNNDLEINGSVLGTATDPFWEALSPEESRWDQHFPFQLLLLKEPGHQTQASFTLPIPPTSLHKTIPFAMDVEASLGGVVEQSNGAPIRPITFRGTTGVLPARPQGKALAPFSAAQAIFAGTLSGAVQTAAGVVSTAAGSPSNLGANLVTDTDLAGGLKGTTGYYQFLLLESFLEAYANLKKTAAGRDYRLALAYWKTKEVYLITPTFFEVAKDASSPHEFQFTFSCKAWKRIKPDQQQFADLSGVSPVARSPNLMAQVLQRLDSSRRAIAGAQQALQGVVGDSAGALAETARSVTMFLRDSQGLALTLADLPSSLVRALRPAILAWAGLPSSIRSTGRAFASIPGSIDSEFQEIRSALQALAVETGVARTKSQTQTQPGAHPAEDLFANPQNYVEFLQTITLGTVNAPAPVIRQVSAERDRVRAFRRADFESMRDQVTSAAADYADRLGLGSPTYNAIHGRPPPPAAPLRAATREDFDALGALNQVAMDLGKLAASEAINTDLTAMDYVAGLAAPGGIPFQVPRSSRWVPFPYGASLDTLAAMYLGDPQRWAEIAVLNQLREPYVDEVGFDLPLLVNGSGNQVVVSDASNLYVGQAVWVRSTLAQPAMRHVSKIDVLAPPFDSQAIVTLDGDPTLGSYTVQGQATLHAYLPGTVNSQKLVAIPDGRGPTDAEEFESKPIPGLNVFDSWLRVGGVDVALTPQGDFAITPDGDWALAIGQQNLIQRARTWIGTPVGSVPGRPSTGFPLEAGKSVADLTAQEILSSVAGLPAFDPAFSGVRSVSVNEAGPAAQVTADFVVSGMDQRLPLTFQVKQ